MTKNKSKRVLNSKPYRRKEQEPWIVDAAAAVEKAVQASKANVPGIVSGDIIDPASAVKWIFQFFFRCRKTWRKF